MDAMPLLLTGEQMKHLADVLPDTPETVIATSQLRADRAQAWVDRWPHWQTAVVEDLGQPGEPMLFGHPAAWAAGLFAQFTHWICLNVAQGDAAVMARLMGEQLQRPLRHKDDVYHTLTGPVSAVSHPDVRCLTSGDVPLLAAAPALIRGPDPARLLQERFAAGAIVDGAVVAIAQNYAISPKFGDVGVATLPEFRERGYAAAGAALVAKWLVENGRTPVWSCGADNGASLRVAQKVGFAEVSRRVYLIIDN